MTKQTRIRRFRSDESGATAIEYALLCAIMSIALAAVAGSGGAVEDIYIWVRQLIPALGGRLEEAE